MKKLLFSLTKKDFTVQTFRAGGKGGQNQNKRDTGVRIIHNETGISAEGRTERSQLQNKKLAFERLVDNPKFKLWLNLKAKEIMLGETINAIVDSLMSEDNIVVEVMKDGDWVQEVSG